ncbi:MAG: AbrB/MazE/SpoVT family DNA-binding domain-containing protein [Gammaproteobacteria bacterium]|nr:AbrB/MazE/SpoVT family DNA-binding domain-containing protein [Gammaproteobacteria bacterium]
MTAVTVSSKFQVVIPKNIRESMGIVSGQKIQKKGFFVDLCEIPDKISFWNLGVFTSRGPLKCLCFIQRKHRNTQRPPWDDLYRDG